MASKFPKFPLLPRAIRLQIWYDALPLFGRIINIRFKKEVLPNGKYQYNRAIIHATFHPALLHINREARKELKRFYSAPFNGPNSPRFIRGEMAKCLAFFATPVSAPNPPAFNLGAMATLVPDLLINYEIDTLYFSCFDDWSWPQSLDLNTIVSRLFIPGSSLRRLKKSLIRIAGNCDFYTAAMHQIDNCFPHLENSIPSRT